MISRSFRYFPLLACMLLAACGSPEERAANYLDKAEALYEQEDYVTARIEALNAAQIEPRNADVRFLLAKIEEKEQNIRKAVGHLQVAIDADPNHLDSRIRLGSYYVLAKAAEQAAEQAAVASTLAPDNAEVHLLQARVNYLNENNDAARKEVDIALATDPALVAAIMFKAGLDMGDGNPEGAMQLIADGIASADPEGVKQLRQFRILLLRATESDDEVEAELKALIEDYPDEQDFPLALAQLFVTQERFDEAETLYRRYVDQDPEDPARRIEFVRFVGTHRGPEAAVEALQEFIVEFPDSMELQLALGQLHESIEEPDEALVIFEKIAATDPKSEIGLRARNRIAAIKVQKEDVAGARTVIESILTDDQNNAEALMMRAAFRYVDKEFNEAVADLRTVLRVRPDSERALLLLARSHRAADNRELAHDAYRRLIEMNPGHPAASAELAESLAQSGDIPMAEEVLRDQLEVTPDDRRAASRLVEALLLKGDLAGAELQARSMLDFGDETGLAEFQLGRVLQAKQSPEEAIESYKAALAKNPDAPEPLQGLTAILVEQDRTDEAIAFLRTHLDAYPTQTAPRLLLAAVFARQGETVAAAEQYEQIISLQPEATRAYASLAALYPDDPTRRRDVYRRAVAANPQEPTINLLLASEYERAGQFEDAIKIYDTVLETNADNPIAANNLAALMLDHRTDADSHARALRLVRQFENSKQPALLDTLGWAHYRNGDYQNAIRLLEEAVEGADQVALLRYHLGMAFVKAGMKDRGREELERALRLTNEEFTGIEEARTTLAELGGSVDG